MFFNRFYFAALLFFCAGTFSPGYAVPPLVAISSAITCKTNPVAIKNRAIAAMKAAPFFNVASLPTTSYVLVLRVDFSDVSMTKSKSETQEFFKKMKEFYLENSYGVLSVSATVSNNVYRLNNSNAFYAQGICSNYSDLVQDTVGKATDINFANGAPGGNSFHHIMVYHAGNGAETTSGADVCASGNIWSVFLPTVSATADRTSGVRQPLTKNGILFSGATVVPETEAASVDPLGVICHEYGHQLGLPDLYKNSAQSVVGEWSLMDSGIYVGSPQGSNPAHLDAWSKQYLGFTHPRTVSVSGQLTTQTLDYAARAADAVLRVPIQGVSGVDSSQEYFLIERRANASKTGKTYDDALPFGGSSEGYIIWHIDDTIAANEDRLSNNNVNNGSPHYGVDVVEAGGGGRLSSTSGSASDPFPGSRNQLLFAAPSSNAFNNTVSNITMSGFSGSILSAKSVVSADDSEVVKTINFPNPAGPSYAQKSGAAAGTITTIVVQTSRSVTGTKLTIHDLSGVLIRNVSADSMTFNLRASADRKFVYEYDWDGKDDNGNNAASGVYLYRFKADDSVLKTGQLVIVR